MGQCSDGRNSVKRVLSCKHNQTARSDVGGGNYTYSIHIISYDTCDHIIHMFTQHHGIVVIVIDVACVVMIVKLSSSPWKLQNQIHSEVGSIKMPSYIRGVDEEGGGYEGT